MNMLRIDFTQLASDLGPGCTTCGAPTRLVGVEPHLTKTNTDLRTYQCLLCERIQTEVVPLMS